MARLQIIPPMLFALDVKLAPVPITTRIMASMPPDILGYFISWQGLFSHAFSRGSVERIFH